MSRRLLSLGVLFVIGVSLCPRGSSATVEEQRARLPPPAECPDKVEGNWAAMVFDERHGTWYDYQLEIHRSSNVPTGNAAGPIEGTMTSHYWYGGPGEDKPPTCVPGRRELTVKMKANGSIDERGTVIFGAKTYTIDSVQCGASGRYNPDNFSGTIDNARQEFQSVNNDGGNAVNEPAVFRRVRCLDSAFRGTAKATPPAFAPPKHGWSCGR